MRGHTILIVLVCRWEDCSHLSGRVLVERQISFKQPCSVRYMRISSSHQTLISHRSGETPRYSGNRAYESTQTHGTSRATKSYHQSGGYNDSSGNYFDSSADTGAQADSSTAALTDRLGGLTVTEAIGYEPQYLTAPPADTNKISSEYAPAYPPIGQSTAVPAQEKTRHVYGTEGEVEKLDSSYKVRKKDYETFFVVGRVFSTLWTESFEGIINDQNQTFVSEVALGGRVYSKIRRFVVVRQSDRSCICLPVTSYNGRGPKKGKINLLEHGYIYSHKTPKPVPGIEKKPIKINLVKGEVPLRDPSLVNYGRVYTVETNVKVREVGLVDTASRKILLSYWKNSILGDDEQGGPVPQRDAPTRAIEISGVGAGAVATYPGTTQRDLYPPSVPMITAYTSVPSQPVSSQPVSNQTSQAGISSTYYPPNPYTRTPGYSSTSNTAYEANDTQSTSYQQPYTYSSYQYPSTTSGGYDTTQGYSSQAGVSVSSWNQPASDAYSRYPSGSNHGYASEQATMGGSTGHQSAQVHGSTDYTQHVTSSSAYNNPSGNAIQEEDIDLEDSSFTGAASVFRQQERRASKSEGSGNKGRRRR